MGLDISHDTWTGAYSAFHAWRSKIAEVAGLPPLGLMEGFYNPDVVMGNPFWMINREEGGGHYAAARILELLPIQWDALKPSPLHELLYHSDCDGGISWENCAGIADELERLIPLLPVGDDPGHIGNWKDKTAMFCAGLRRAHAAKENLEFY